MDGRNLSYPIIQFDSVSKNFTLSANRAGTLQEKFLHFVKRQSPTLKECFWAIQDISLKISHGESVALIGPNGAGKSTILKLISRIIVPTSGSVRVNGRIAALLELGSGFHPELTGRENIALNGSLMGMDKHEVDQRLDEIIDFAELENFIDMPVKHYSSGMYMRLGFSVASHIDPDVLLVDEVLAVGDQAFQSKCLDRVKTLIQDGTTILFVSHDLSTVRNVCKRAIWIDKGTVRLDGTTEEAINAYSHQVATQMGLTDELVSIDTELDTENQQQRWGNRDIEITDVQLLNNRGEESEIFATGEAITIRIDFFARKQIKNPVFGLAIYRSDGLHVSGPNNQQAGIDIPIVKGTGSVFCTVDKLPLLTGDYQLSVAAYDDKLLNAYDHHHKAYLFSVRGNRSLFGVIEWAGQWEVRTNDLD
jgi:lipopolysaccharide transport system ATP-binding protein